MSTIPLLPFERVLHAAETLSDPRIKSQLLSVLAQQQLATGQFDAALQTFATIPVPQERRTALLIADFQSFPSEKVKALAQLLTADTQTDSLAGQLAITMLEAKNAASAWKLVEITKGTFESERQRYEFFEKALQQLQAEDWEKILRLYQTFESGTHRDWALLAMIKYLIGQQRYAEAEEFADSIALPLRRSWAYWEMYRLTAAKQCELYLDKAIAIVETATMNPDDEEMMEMLATQLRIFGHGASQRSRKDLGERLLERSESVAASLNMPMQRCRLQCFLGKVLRELKQIMSIREYLAIDTMLESLRSNLDRSQVSVWLAEAGWDEGWAKAIEVISVLERGTTELERSQRIASVLKRFVAHHQGLDATGNPSEDSVRISGEEFESRYFNPFAEADCGC
jgi:tetratricopeptide (TPR) repeat protein